MNDSCLISVLYQSYTYETVLRLVSHISFSVSRLLRMIKGGFQMSDAMPVNTTFNWSNNGIIMAINNQHPHQHESSLMQHYHFLQRAQAITSLALSSYCWMLLLPVYGCGCRHDKNRGKNNHPIVSTPTTRL